MGRIHSGGFVPLNVHRVGDPLKSSCSSARIALRGLYIRRILKFVFIAPSAPSRIRPFVLDLLI
jgi:hypothetical protein